MKRSIDTLDLPKDKIDELKTLGYYYLNDLKRDYDSINHILGTDISTLTKAPPIQNAFELLQDDQLNGCLLSYNKKLDELLQDVIRNRTVTELAGNSGCGKTQVCFQLSVSVQLPKWCGGLAGEALFIETNRNFSTTRVKELASRFIDQYNSLKIQMNKPSDEFNVDYIMKHIHFVNINTCMELMACLLRLDDYMQNKNIRLVVIDSISHPLRQIEDENRIGIMTELFGRLRELANKFNVAVILTNDLTTRVNENVVVVTPSFGDTFYHMVNTRILLSKNKQGFRAQLLKAVGVEQKVVDFNI